MATITSDNIVRSIYQVDVPRQNVYQFVRSSTHDVQPDTLALVSTATGQSFTYPEFWNQVDNVSQQLQQRGFKEGQVLAIYCHNCPEYLITLFSVWKVGGSVACVNSLWTTGEVAAFFSKIMPAWALTTSQLAPIVSALKEKFRIKAIIVASGTYPGCVPWTDMSHMTRKTASHVTFPRDSIRPTNDWQKRCALIVSSSGTTGLPKAVDLSHGSITASLALRKHPSCRFSSPRSVIFQPLALMQGITYTLMSLSNGASIWLMPKFSLEKYLEIVSIEKISVLTLVPTVLIQMVKSPLTSRYDLSHVTEVGCGSSSLGSTVFERLKSLLSIHATIRQGYAMTETAGAGTIASGQKAASSVGIPMPNLDMKVIDPKTGATLAANQQGEICIRSPTLMTGYIGNPRATLETIDSDHWLHTGDLGYYGYDGYFYFVERLKELIKYSSYQVAPAELEALLLGHPAVAEVGVFGVPDPTRGELPMAWVILEQQHQGITTEKDIMDFVAERVAHYKRLRGGVRFVSSIPKSQNGKILRWKMREEMARDRARAKL